MKNKIKFFIFVFFLFIPEFVYSNDNLANFIIRDYSEGELPIVGNPDAKYTIVEFFDYRCGYCSKQANDLAKILEEKNNVKIIYLEFPIFGGISDTVARIALSIWNSNPELYFDVHNKFMNLGPRMNNLCTYQNGGATGTTGKSFFMAPYNPGGGSAVEHFDENHVGPLL